MKQCNEVSEIYTQCCELKMLIWNSMSVIILLSGCSVTANTLVTGIKTILREYMGRSTTAGQTLALTESGFFETTTTLHEESTQGFPDDVSH